MTKLVILGAGGLAREVVDVINHINERCGYRYEILGYIDENSSKWGEELNGFKVLGNFEWLNSNKEKENIKAVIGVGNPKSRYQMVGKALKTGLDFETLIHPNVVMTKYVSIGKGVVVTAGNVITNNIEIGDFSFINLSCTIGHDTVIGKFVNVNPGVNISGGVFIGDGAEIGTGAAIIQYVKIGEGSIVGAGAVVTKDIPPNVTVVGVPAKVIKNHTPNWWKSDL